MKKPILIASAAVIVGCANSPFRMNNSSDSELIAGLSRENAGELCRLYLRGIRFITEDPSSGFAGTSYRANALIEAEWIRRGISKETCASPDAIAAIRAKIDSERAERAARAAAPRQSVSSQDQRTGSGPINCTSTRVYNSVFTNCN